MNTRCLTSPSTHKPAFTLVEIVTSLAILSILLAACGSIVAMAGLAAGDGSNRNLIQQRTADAASQMTDDLNVAINFTQRTPTATTFTVPDRLNAGTPQVVSYSWSGVSGAALMRQFNGGPATSILSGVQNLNLTYTPRLMGPVPGPAEQVLFSHDAATGSFVDGKITNKNAGSQYFTPSLPLGTASYTLTRIKLVLKSRPQQNNALNVSLVYPDVLFRPTGATVARTTVYEAALSTQYEWVNIPFSGLSNQNPLQPLCIVLTAATGSTDAGAAQVDQSLLSILSLAYWSTSTNSGSSWGTGVSTTVARVYVYGTVP